MCMYGKGIEVCYKNQGFKCLIYAYIAGERSLIPSNTNICLCRNYDDVNTFTVTPVLSL